MAGGEDCVQLSLQAERGINVRLVSSSPQQSGRLTDGASADVPDDMCPQSEGVFVHADARLETGHIGPGSRVWAFAHVLGGARIGSDTDIGDYVFIENDVVVGDRVTIKSGVQLWDGLRVEDDVFIGPNATFTNDRFPRSKQPPSSFARTTIAREHPSAQEPSSCPVSRSGSTRWWGPAPSSRGTCHPSRLSWAIRPVSPATSNR